MDQDSVNNIMNMYSLYLASFGNQSEEGLELQKEFEKYLLSQFKILNGES